MTEHREFGEVIRGATYVLRPGGYAVPRRPAGEIALVSTPEGLFLPGGGQVHGETAEEAAVRETYEECGLRIRLGTRLGVADELLFDAGTSTYFRKRCVFFRAEPVGRVGRGEPDHRLVWMAPEEAARALRHESQRWAVSQAFRPSGPSETRW